MVKVEVEVSKYTDVYKDVKYTYEISWFPKAQTITLTPQKA